MHIGSAMFKFICKILERKRSLITEFNKQKTREIRKSRTRAPISLALIQIYAYISYKNVPVEMRSIRLTVKTSSARIYSIRI